MSAGAVGAYFDIDALPVVPPLVSLLSSAYVVEHPAGDHEWINGVTWTPEYGDPPAHPYWWQNPLGAGATAETTYTSKVIGDPPAKREARAFDVWVGLKGSTFQWRGRDVESMVRRGLNAFVSRIVAAELWTGTIVQAAGFPNDYLQKAPTQLNGGTQLGTVRALAELEQAIADNEPGNGVIHAQARLVALWSQNGLLLPNASGKRLFTHQGNLVVPDQGYPGYGPAAPSSGATVAASWAFATGPVRVDLGAPGPVSGGEVSSSDNTSDGLGDSDIITTTNDVRYRIERAALVTWDGNTKHTCKVDHTTAY